MPTTAPQIRTDLPAAGTWTIDGSHSSVEFVVRHLMVSKVRGRFEDFHGEIEVGQRPEDSKVAVAISAGSVSTGDEGRDGHLRSADFFEVDTHQVMTYRSTAVKPDGDDWRLEGELTLHGVTRSVPLKLELNGFTADPYGGTRAGFSASGEISRGDFGIEFNMPMDGGGVVVGDKISIQIEIEAVLSTS